MAIEKKQIPFAPWKGLYLDGVTVPGGMSKAENVIILQDGTAERRPYERTLAESVACIAGSGLKKVYELLKSDATRYIYADVNVSETTTTAFGDEEITHFASWTDPASWSYGSSKWTHSSGTTSLVATSEVAIVAATKYRVVVSVTCPAVSTSVGNWTYAHTDSTYDWTTKEASVKVIWLNTWTHAAGATTALICKDFTPVIGASYVIKMHVTHTSGTNLTVTIGGVTAGVISSTGTHTLIARYCTSAALLTFTPTSDWVGVISKTFPRIPATLDKWVSVVRLADPAGANTPSNYDYTESTHSPSSWYLNGAELTYYEPSNWYANVAAYSGQSVSVYLGNKLAGTITTSGEYSYNVKATNTDALKFTPTSDWGGDIISASVKKMTQSVAATKTKIMGGTVTGTTDYEVTFSDILNELTSGDAIRPHWTSLQDRAFRVDGTNLNRWFDDATSYHTLGCPAPNDAPTTSSTTGGEVLAGAYNVYYTYVKKYGTYVVEGNPSPSSQVTVAGTAINVVVTACTESDVDYIRIYRTLYGEPGSYAYFDREVPNASGTILLTADDDTIRDTLSTLEFDHDMPPLGKFVLGAGSRLWLIDADGTLHWSRLDEPELMPSANYQTFDPKDGDTVTGICPLRKNLLVFKRRRTWILDMFSESVTDDGVAALAKDVVSSNYGCTASGSISAVGTDSAIWLSHAGFIRYDGGTFKNISAGDPNTGVPSRIQSVVNSFIANGAENFIESAYHSSRQLYHVNFIYRTDGEISDQRHFVYNMVTDSWTEYVYRTTAGVKTYETNFALAHDSLGNEVLLIPYLSTTTGLITYIYQGEYEGTSSATVSATKILDSAGAGGTALANPVYSINDASDNTYVLAENGVVFKVTSAGVKSCILTEAGLIAIALGPGHPASPSERIVDVVVDQTHSCFYFSYFIVPA